MGSVINVKHWTVSVIFIFFPGLDRIDRCHVPVEQHHRTTSLPLGSHHSSQFRHRHWSLSDRCQRSHRCHPHLHPRPRQAGCRQEVGSPQDLGRSGQPVNADRVVCFCYPKLMQIFQIIKFFSSIQNYLLSFHDMNFSSKASQKAFRVTYSPSHKAYLTA